MVMLEELETVAAPSDFTDFLTGVSVGIAIGLLICGC
jgi:hypothetical protein